MASQYAANPRQSMPAVAAQLPLITFPPRPPPGRAGRRLTVTTNHFELLWAGASILSHYHVEIDPVPSGDVARRNYEIIDHLQTITSPQTFHPRASYDGKANLYAPVEYVFGGEEKFHVLMSSKRPPPPPGTPGHFIVTLTLVNTARPQLLMDYVQGGKAPSSTEVLQIMNCLNVIIRQAAIQRWPHNARSFFTTADMRPLAKGLNLVRGYFQSVRPTPGKILVNVDISTGILWSEGPLLDVVMEFLGKRNIRDLENLHDRELGDLNRYLKNVRVRSTHKPGTRGKPIHKFDKLGSDKIILETDGRTIAQYFLDTYNIKLQYPNICCAWVSRSAALPLEVCMIEPGQLYKKKVNDPAMLRQVLDFSTRRPEQRIATIVNGLGDMMYDTSDYMTKAGLRVGAQPIRFEARQLRGANVVYKAGAQEVQEGAWNLRGRQFVQGATLRVWAIINLCPGAGRGAMARPQVQQFVQTLVRSMRDCGMRVEMEFPDIFDLVNTGRIEDELLKIGKGLIDRLKVPHPDLFVIITNGSADLYTRVKHWGDIVTGTATQHVRVDKVVKANPQYCANVAMKINLKMSGRNHLPAGEAIKFIGAAPCMVMGADTSHPGPGDTEKPSISALAASLDEHATVYVSTVRVQEGRLEIIADLKEMVEWAVGKFQEYQAGVHKRMNIVPQRIIFYRDGVSEGQFAEVCTREVQAIRDAFTALKMRQPKITFMVVGKRHHVRFFPERQNADRTGNAPAGLVVDTDVSHPYEWDFYLQSHAGLLGTSRPMHVSVVVDDNGLNADQLQELTFTLTHNFPRATRTVSIPTPVYHADLACGRANIHFDPHANGSGSGMSGLASYQQAFKQVHPKLANRMFWM
ncbi:Piwi-domain-containing protein [Calocera cornea HHB12733]|uniref:Piwi-domain-containing protein n=1 Tax=Calocera cornea HHB12733 TaxID=1353952 RepID=A0A165J8K2_9BASI|nr:Piwi-domain-containing protein [Calocera cornea HHB12733]